MLDKIFGKKEIEKENVNTNPRIFVIDPEPEEPDVSKDSVSMRETKQAAESKDRIDISCIPNKGGYTVSIMLENNHQLKRDIWNCFIKSPRKIVTRTISPNYEKKKLKNQEYPRYVLVSRDFYYSMSIKAGMDNNPLVGDMSMAIGVRKITEHYGGDEKTIVKKTEEITFQAGNYIEYKHLINQPKPKPKEIERKRSVWVADANGGRGTYIEMTDRQFNEHQEAMASKVRARQNALNKLDESDLLALKELVANK